MADDLREREPLRDQGDNPPEDGTRGDLAGSSGTSGGVAPGGPAVERADRRMADAGGGAGETNPLDDVKHPTADE